MNAPPPPPTLDDIFALVDRFTRLGPSLYEHTSLQGEGIYGDDIDELLTAFAERYGVDMAGYRWYFHTGPEGFNPLWYIFPPPNMGLKEIPITPALLLESALRKVWAVEYPPHTPPKDGWQFRGCGWVVGVIAVLVFLAALAQVLGATR